MDSNTGRVGGGLRPVGGVYQHNNISTILCVLAVAEKRGGSRTGVRRGLTKQWALCLNCRY